MSNAGKRGFTLVEVVIATSIILAFILALLSVYSLYLRTAFSNSSAVRATFLAEEGLEVMRFMRNADWENINSLSRSTAYELVFSGSTWAATTTAQAFIDGTFERKVYISEVYRSASHDIVSSGGTLDPGTVKVTSSVSWQKDTSTTTKSISTYLTDLLEE